MVEKFGRILATSRSVSGEASSSDTASSRVAIVSRSVDGWMSEARRKRAPAPVLQWLSTPNRESFGSPVRLLRSTSRLETVAGSRSIVPSTCAYRTRSVPLTNCTESECSAAAMSAAKAESPRYLDATSSSRAASSARWA